MPDFIDTLSENAGQRTEQIRQVVIDEVLTYWQRYSLSRPDVLANLRNVDFVTRIMADYGGQELVNQLEGQYQNVIGEVERQIGQVPSEVIDSLRSQDRAIYQGHLRDAGRELNRGVARAVTGRMSFFEVEKTLKSATAALADYQVNALVNTSFRTFNRGTFEAATRDLPTETRYFYIGPFDDRTRDECAAVLTQQTEQGFTRAEIAGLPVDMVNGGGWSCRHDWRVNV